MKQIYNPFLPLDEYIPDGEPHVFGDRVYLFGSHDQEGGSEYCMLDYVAYSAPVDDLRSWRREGVIYSADDDPDHDERRRHLYAPDVVRGPDGRYYLYYALAGGCFTSPIHTAVFSEPAGRYRYFGCVRNQDGSPFTRCITFDPAVINDGGAVRLYYGWSLATDRLLPPMTGDSPAARAMREKLLEVQLRMFEKTRAEIEAEPAGIMGAFTVRLADDMLTVLSEPTRILPGQFDAGGTEFAGHAFFEGSSIRKIGDAYCFIYSSEQNHELCYAVSGFPDRGFRFGGTIVSNGDIGFAGRAAADRANATGNNHGSIEKIAGQWYVFYHRQTHKSPYSRQACAEPITVLPGVKIPQVEMTSCGLNGGPLAAEGVYPAAIACGLTNGKMPHLISGTWSEPIPFISHGGGQRFISDIQDGTSVTYKYFAFKGKGSLLLTLRGDAAGELKLFIGDKEQGSAAVSPHTGWCVASVGFDAAGVFPLRLLFRGRGALKLLQLEFR